MSSSVRCLNCRREWSDPIGYLSHECPTEEAEKEATELWEDEAHDPVDLAFDPDEVAGEIAAIGDRLGELFGEMIELERLRGALDDDDDDPFFADWDEPTPNVPGWVAVPVLFLAGLAVAGLAVVDGVSRLFRWAVRS